MYEVCTGQYNQDILHIYLYMYMYLFSEMILFQMFGSYSVVVILFMYKVCTGQYNQDFLHIYLYLFSKPEFISNFGSCSW